jgi:uncharacterized protein YkwD
MKVLASLVALAAATAVAAPTLGVSPRKLVDDAAPHADDPNFISAVMRAHWYWRKLHCAQDLVWDPELAKEARKDVEKCTKKPTHVSLPSPSQSCSASMLNSGEFEWLLI